MNEQDFIRKIEENTKDIPIPESVSPKTMKDLLDNATQYTENDNRETTNQNNKAANHTDTVSNRRLVKRLTLAACFVLCFAGSIYTAKLVSVHNDKKQNSRPPQITEDTISTEDSKNKEVSSSRLNVPESYEEYYNTLKEAYDKYYDSITDVNTFGDKEIIYEESAVEDMSSQKLSNSVDRGMQDSAIAENEATNDSASKNFSSTNTQEETVDEGDIIKTDGSYIYKVMKLYNHETGMINAHLTITKADNGKLTTMSSIDLDTVIKYNDDEMVDFQEFYLHKNKLYLLFAKSDYSDTSLTNNETVIVIYDLADKEQPKKVKTLTQSGYFESSRISDGYLYTMSNFCETSLEDKMKYKQYIPSINNKLIPCNRIYYPTDILMDTTHVVTSLNLNEPDDFTDTKAIPTNGNSYYVSDSSIYFYTTSYGDITKTEIMKLNYKKGKLSAGNSATISGYLYDSFALNEYNGFLRVVATIPANNFSLLRGATVDMEVAEIAPEPTVVKENVNALYILDENMELAGKISGIAPGETIQSARFMGDIGYFVTFRNMDPLFSVDLSNPQKPEIIGSLKISGFSSYLHFYDKNLMLGIGQEVDPKTQEWLGLKLSMFDISNPSDVTEQDKYIIENSVMSDALYNHKAIMIDPEKNIFGFAYGASTYKQYYEYKYYYATYTYDKEEGFIETAKYRINDDEYDYNSIRGIYIGDYFYLTTNRSITSYKIGSEQSISTVTYKGA